MIATTTAVARLLASGFIMSIWSKLALTVWVAATAFVAGGSAASAAVTFSDGNGTPGFVGDGVNQHFDIQGGPSFKCANVDITDGTIDSTLNPVRVSFTPIYSNCQVYLGSPHPVVVATIGEWTLQVNDVNDAGPL